jgi:hypothetical protein
MLRSSVARLLAVFVIVPGVASAARVAYDKQAKAVAEKLKPLGLTAKADPNGLKQVAGQIAAVLTELEKAAATNGPGTHALLKTAYEKYRPDVGPAQRSAAITAVNDMWNEARALGAFDERHQYTGKILKGADVGNDAVLEYIVPLDLAPSFSKEIANIRLTAPGRARSSQAQPTDRELAYQATLDAIVREIAGMKTLAEIARPKAKDRLPPVAVDASGLSKEEALKRWKKEMAENGDTALELPSIALTGQMTETPSKRNGYKWQLEAELVNLSHHATEVELQVLVLGTTWKNRENYVMLDVRQKVQLRSIQHLRVGTETLEEKVYKSRGDLYEKLDPKQAARSQANYRGTLWLITHPKGQVAVCATDNALLEMLDAGSRRSIENMARLYLPDPKDWVKPASTAAK